MELLKSPPLSEYVPYTEVPEFSVEAVREAFDTLDVTNIGGTAQALRAEGSAMARPSSAMGFGAIISGFDGNHDGFQGIVERVRDKCCACSVSSNVFS